MEYGTSYLWGLARVDALSLVMTGLIAFVGWVIFRYSGNYLEGDAGRRRFRQWFWMTLGCVMILVNSNHLLLLALSWIGTSLSLHRLLLYFPERPAAVLAAHKKFLLSRLGDLCLMSGLFLVGRHYGSFRLDDILGAAALQHGAAGGSLQWGGALLAVAAVLKCAQLPFHGWLIQVMEAPTPVSALLHAGIINLGGFLMIRLSPVLAHAEVAQWILLTAGTATAIIAGLVMMTRVSIKVMLAWSTCAQMGFMLLECGLGAYSLALLHLVAHSLYKAWAFLGSGRTVSETVRRRSTRFARRPRFAHWLTALPLSAVLVAGLAWIFRIHPEAEPAIWTLGGILAIALATLAAEGMAAGEGRTWLLVPGLGLFLGALYFAWHQLFGVFVGPLVAHVPPPEGAAGFVLAAFLLQYVVISQIRLRPGHILVRSLHDYMYQGLYLDEIFTFVTLHLWPLSR